MVLDDGWVVKNKNDIKKKEEVGKLIWFSCFRLKGVDIRWKLVFFLVLHRTSGDA